MRRTTRVQTALRDIEITKMVAQGFTERAVAKAFGVSQQTVNRAVHRRIKRMLEFKREQREKVRR